MSKSTRIVNFSIKRKDAPDATEDTLWTMESALSKMTKIHITILTVLVGKMDNA